jgi:dTMP kinase
MDGVEEQTIWDLARHAELPDLAVVLTASPDVLAARVATRGPESRWERYPGNSAIEAGLYLAAAAGLRARGVEVVCVDSGATPAPAIADQVAEPVRARCASASASRSGLLRS